MRGRKAFTLIELMIVVAIIGILAAVAIPKFAEMLAIPKLKKMGYSERSVRGFLKAESESTGQYCSADQVLHDKELREKLQKWCWAHQQ